MRAQSQPKGREHQGKAKGQSSRCRGDAGKGASLVTSSAEISKLQTKEEKTSSL